MERKIVISGYCDVLSLPPSLPPSSLVNRRGHFGSRSQIFFCRNDCDLCSTGMKVYLFVFLGQDHQISDIRRTDMSDKPIIWPDLADTCADQKLAYSFKLTHDVLLLMFKPQTPLLKMLNNTIFWDHATNSSKGRSSYNLWSNSLLHSGTYDLVSAIIESGSRSGSMTKVAGSRFRFYYIIAIIIDKFELFFITIWFFKNVILI